MGYNQSVDHSAFLSIRCSCQKQPSTRGFSLQWYHPITIILTAVLCTLPTILLRDSDQWDRKTFWRRVSLHCLSLYAVVAGAGWLFRWYDDTESLISVSVIFFIIYVFVWLSSHWLDKQDEKKINHALDNIRDTE